MDRAQIRMDSNETRYWTDPQRTAAHYAKHCLALLAELEQAERERDEARDEIPKEFLDAGAAQVERAEKAEARLAKVPALVEAMKRIHGAADRTDDSDDLSGLLALMARINESREARRLGVRLMASERLKIWHQPWRFVLPRWSKCWRNTRHHQRTFVASGRQWTECYCGLRCFEVTGGPSSESD